MDQLISKKLIAFVVSVLAAGLLWATSAISGELAITTIKTLGIVYLGVQGFIDLLKLFKK